VKLSVWLIPKEELMMHSKGGVKLTYRVRSILLFLWTIIAVTTHRLFRGPRLSEWTWTFEIATSFLQRQERIAFKMPNIVDQREYTDAFVFASSALSCVQVDAVEEADVKGRWFVPRADVGQHTLLYLHGGGYAFSARAHDNLIALVTLAARARTFALDYRLTPEHPFPAQLEDAQTAYKWLLNTGVAHEHLVVAGDSAGGNLTLALLLALRDAQRPLPALAICLCPWTDMDVSYESLSANERYDWVERRMVIQWREWFWQGADTRSLLLSPLHADLRGLPPIYIQAGEVEILIDMIRAFERRAQEQGAPVSLDVWKQMNHDFQAYGATMRQSREALQRIREVIEQLPTT
jgi:epsilon-lactone hydrolase